MQTLIGIVVLIVGLLSSTTFPWPWSQPSGVSGPVLATIVCGVGAAIIIYY